MPSRGCALANRLSAASSLEEPCDTAEDWLGKSDENIKCCCYGQASLGAQVFCIHVSAEYARDEWKMQNTLQCSASAGNCSMKIERSITDSRS